MPVVADTSALTSAAAVYFSQPCVAPNWSGGVNSPAGVFTF